MGCGSSSLKGEKVTTVNSEPAEQPIKRVQTNFSDVDFTGDRGGARRGKSFAVAPDEHRRPTRISETYNEDPIPAMPQKGTGAVDGTKLAPYHTIDGDNALDSPEATTKIPHVNLPASDPTSSSAKAAYASANQPATENAAHQESTLSSSTLQPTEGTDGRKQSWYARAQARLSNRNTSQISDEELLRVFGMTRPEWDAYVANPKNRVGPHALPSDLPGGGLGAGFA